MPVRDNAERIRIHVPWRSRLHGYGGCPHPSDILKVLFKPSSQGSGSVKTGMHLARYADGKKEIYPYAQSFSH